MAFRLKIEGNDLVVFEDGIPETEYISNPTAVTVAKFTDTTHVQFYDYSQKIDGGRDPFLLGEENNSFVITSLIDNTTGLAFTSVASFKTFIRSKIGYFISCSSGGSGVQSVTGDGVDNTDPLNPILSFPDADEVDDTSTTNKFATQAQLDQIATNTSDIAGKRDTTAQKNSIEDDGGDLQLVNDAAIPGSEKYYGTDLAGAKGFFDLPSGVGDMEKSVYDPNNVQDDAFDYANFLGTFQITGTPQTVNLSSDIDNLVVTSNIVDLTTSSQDRRITGIVAPPAGVNRVIFFYNQSSQYRIKFVNQSGSSTAANRIVLRSQAGTRNLLQFQMAMVSYNHLLDRWYVSRIG